ncbi:MAG: nicotinamidase [Gammaproteobacteria bacterium]|jgi:nicotinamidase/pyrazinamidase
MPETKTGDANLRAGDALLVVDMQNDFMPGGALGVHGGDQIVPEVNRLVEKFIARRLPIVFSRDWHPPNHCSFGEQGGIWPVHCVQHTKGAAFTTGLAMPADPSVISKATKVDHEAYSAFDGTGLSELLTRLEVTRIFIVGLATDYCVLETVRDARREGFEVVVLEDGVRAVNVHPEDGPRALQEMARLGAEIVNADALGLASA